MSTQLIHIYRIAEHPIKYLPDSIKERYLAGLACVLYNMSDGNGTMKVLFEQWAYSIMGCDMSHLFLKHDAKSVSEALSLNRVGLRFFRCKHEFFFDCFYLTETYDKALLPKLQEYLNVVGRSFFTKLALQQTEAYFTNKQGEVNVSENLTKHRDLNRDFQNKPVFRVLVVANVSAGKSTLINAITGYSLNRATCQVCTNRVTPIYNKPQLDGVTFVTQSGELKYNPELGSINSDNFERAALWFDSLIDSIPICLIDTPGSNSAVEIQHKAITEKAISDNAYDLLLFVSNGENCQTNDEEHLLKFIHKLCRKPIVFVINKLDSFDCDNLDDSISQFIKDYNDWLRELKFRNPIVIPIAARPALLAKKAGRNQMTKREKDELQRYIDLFEESFYDFPQYVNGQSPSTSFIDKTGIRLLETIILTISNIIKR